MLSFVAGMIDVFLINPMLGIPVSEAGQGGLLQFLLALALLIPTIAIGVWRLHDIGKSGWLATHRSHSYPRLSCTSLLLCARFST